MNPDEFSTEIFILLSVLNLIYGLKYVFHFNELLIKKYFFVFYLEKLEIKVSGSVTLR